MPTVPKGKICQALAKKGKTKTIKLKHSMSPQEIKRVVLDTFGIKDYTILEPDSTGHNLLKARLMVMLLLGEDVFICVGILRTCGV